MASNYSSNTIHLSDELTQKVITVGVTETELLTGGARNAKRQLMRIYNDGAQVAYIGPTGVTASGSTRGEPLQKKQSMEIVIGDVGIYAIVASSTTDIIVTELA